MKHTKKEKRKARPMKVKWGSRQKKEQRRNNAR